MAAHRGDEDRMREGVAQHRDRRCRSFPDNAAHSVWLEDIIAEGAAVLAERPLIASPVGDEHIDALREARLRFSLEQVGADDL